MYFLGFCLIEQRTAQQPPQQHTQQGTPTQSKQARKIRLTITSTFTAGKEMGERGKEEERGRKEEGGRRGGGSGEEEGKGEGREAQTVEHSISFPLCIYYILHGIEYTAHVSSKTEA